MIALVVVTATVACGEPASTERKGEDPPKRLLPAADDEAAGPAPVQPEAAQPEAAQPEDPLAATAEAEPNPEADARLKNAREHVFSDPGLAFDEAKAAYDLRPSRDTLLVMGTAACRLKDTEKATFAIARLEGDDRSKMIDICAAKGVRLEAPAAG